MEGISIHRDRSVLILNNETRTDIFRPMGMRRAVSDVTFTRRPKEKPDSSSTRKNNVPVVSVQYDVPARKVDGPLMYRFRKLHTSVQHGQQVKVHRSKSEDKLTSYSLFDKIQEFPLKHSARFERRIQEEKEERQNKQKQDQLTGNVDSHRLKGLGVGKFYTEYNPPPTAPEPSRKTQMTPSTPGMMTPATTPGLLYGSGSQRSSTTPSQQSKCQDPSHVKLSLTSSRPNTNDNITNNGHISRQTKNNQILDHNVEDGSPSKSRFTDYSNSPILLSHQGHHHDSKGQGHSYQYKMKSNNYVNGEQIFGYNNSSSTPTVPYSTADILYGNEVNGRGQNEDGRQSSYDSERNKELSRAKSKDLEHPNNRRPNSKSGSRKSLTIESVNLDRDKDEVTKGLTSALPPAKVANHFRPNGIRSVKEPIYSSKTNGAISGREQDDMVAMGTLWNPNNPQGLTQGQQQSVSTAPSSQQQQVTSRQNSTNSNTNSYPSKTASSSNNVHQSMSSNNTMTAQRKYTSNNIRPIQAHNNVSGKRNNLKDQEADPKYTDPLIGAPASFQQRIIELGALEGDTVRWERTKRLKKKKQDRDS